jgi:hypothetical protein
MADTKYGKYLTKTILTKTPDGKPMISTRHLDDFVGNNFSIDCGFVTEPFLMIPQAHKHDFDQYLCILGANQNDPGDFDAEVEYSLGEEHEKHIINSPTIVFIPAGLAHGPLNFAKINKPVLFVDIAQSNKYYRIWEEGEPEEEGEGDAGEGGDGGGGE